MSFRLAGFFLERVFEHFLSAIEWSFIIACFILGSLFATRPALYDCDKNTFVFYRRWPRIKTIPLMPAFLVIPFLVYLMW